MCQLVQVLAARRVDIEESTARAFRARAGQSPVTPVSPAGNADWLVSRLLRPAVSLTWPFDMTRLMTSY